MHINYCDNCGNKHHYCDKRFSIILHSPSTFHNNNHKGYISLNKEVKRQSFIAQGVVPWYRSDAPMKVCSCIMH